MQTRASRITSRSSKSRKGKVEKVRRHSFSQLIVNRTLMVSVMAGLIAAGTGSYIIKSSALSEDVLAWSVRCNIDHFGPDDPIVYPNVPGASHMHSFFSNKSTNAYSTPNSLMGSAGSCGRNMGAVDRSAYWVPSLFKVNADGSHTLYSSGDQYVSVYYRRAGGSSGPVVKPFPVGLRMIAGNYTATSPQSRSIVYWQCGAGGPQYDTIPSCTGNYANQPVRGDISFPSCWDGVHLDSADHKSHMAYASSNGACPASHPVSLPKINIELWFPSLFNGAGYVVASDSTSRGGISLHGDFYAAWDNQTQNALVTECLNNSHTCIGINRSDDGRRMFIQQGDPYPAITITTADYPATSPYSNLQTPVITSPVQPQSQTPTTTTSTGHNGHGRHAASPSPSPAATPTPASSTSTEAPVESNEAIEAQTASAVESKRSFASLLLLVGSVVVVVGTALMIYQYFRHNRGY